MTRSIIPNVFAVLLLCSGAASAAPAPVPTTTASMVSRCKDAPDICKNLIAAESAKLEAAREACIPKEISKESAADRVMHTAEEVLEEVPGQFENFDYTILARQLMTFLWPCADKPIS
ncbi:MAG: hypothetical protein EXR00_06395 [Alphaproteobacteria bacterium]|nr:hypothetical protein [Alphaproteobacteria bacterium]